MGVHARRVLSTWNPREFLQRTAMAATERRSPATEQQRDC
jgi:hypothetical protein